MHKAEHSLLHKASQLEYNVSRWQRSQSWPSVAWTGSSEQYGFTQQQQQCSFGCCWCTLSVAASCCPSRPLALEKGALRTPRGLSQRTLYMVSRLTFLQPQSRFGDKALELQVVFPQHGTAVLTGLTGFVSYHHIRHNSVTWRHNISACAEASLRRSTSFRPVASTLLRLPPPPTPPPATDSVSTAPTYFATGRTHGTGRRVWHGSYTTRGIGRLVRDSARTGRT